MSDSFTDTTKLVIKQQFEGLEAAANAVANAIGIDALGALGETANKYDVFTNDGGKKYQVVESSEYCCRVCFRPNHSLELHVFQPEVSSSHEVMTFDRPCKCGLCCSLCSICQQEMVITEDGATIGHVKEPILGGGFSPTLNVMDREDGEPVATVKANAICCIGGLCCDHTFQVVDTQTGSVVGKITKQKPEDLGQLASEIVSDADVFELTMDKGIDPKRKASIFGALHLIDYYLFEQEGEMNVDLLNGNCNFKLCDMFCCGCVLPIGCGCGGGRQENAAVGNAAEI
eukprot:Nitzschia sp. Nitz4//scaffold134_size62860//28918//29778//NITZ4_006326-RA/size62860-processed-gene-0.31-mRNA-1//1//CDS//3329535490//8748//frame0